MSGPESAGAVGARHRHRHGAAGDTGDTGAARGTGGTAGNERLTAATGATLLVLFAAEGVTILSVHRLLTLHFFVGMLLIGPVLLKIGSTCYRFARYYTGARPYVSKGPPAPLLRLLGPVVVLTSCGVIGTGVMLAVAGPGPGPWLFLHKAMFVLWFGAMTIHVLAYLPRLGRLAAAGWRGRRLGNSGRRGAVVGGGPARLVMLAAALCAGVVLATVTVHLASPWRPQGHPGAARRAGAAGAAGSSARFVLPDHRGAAGVSGRGRVPDDAGRPEHLGVAAARARRLGPGGMPAALK